MTDPVWITSAVRTPIGSMLGSLSSKTGPQLGGDAIAAALAQARLPASAVEEVIMGCVLSAGLGQAPARQAALEADLPVSAPATTINKMCGSGMKAVMLGCDAIRARSCDVIVAGGMESMSNAPFLLPKARTGMRYGHDRIFDHMALDGLEDAYDRGRPMGAFADDTARELQISRSEQDAYAVRSLERAQKAASIGVLSREIVPVSVVARSGETIVSSDEQPGRAKAAKIPALKPAFSKEGSVTAANASSISDGAAALTLMSSAALERQGADAIARVVSYATFAQEARWFTTAPVGAIRRAAAAAGWELADVDLFEINEAFAVVAIACAKQLDLPEDKLNVFGGACALGHPIGASGARIIVTLINALRDRGLKKGIASACLGGGEATAIAIELV